VSGAKSCPGVNTAYGEKIREDGSALVSDLFIYLLEEVNTETRPLSIPRIMESTFRTWYESKMLATPELVDEAKALAELLRGVQTIAIVGISKNPARDSFFVGRYLKNAGYTIIPVNPTASDILDEVTYPDLASIPVPVEVVDIFRKPEEIPAVVNQALPLHPKAIWLQLGTGVHPDLKEQVEQQGIRFVQNRCIKVDHQFLIREQNF